ncbi:hypothetical protein P691DRAFT_396790 [Macrolepiota fuliginosa MF-IS2]|uniref:Uncharacterized protein n=1 Tax=Macrolepiota fuliginosa MF-IS2 TaxID=1400762 RepID=A0A9P6C6W0_9AGAR|nr:hypothetical protein P691DRAFT_396790 [Macrolepiota fuliginosa MF-IS2]
MPANLPHDVWLNIAGHLPILGLRTLYSVNAALFHIALDARYRQISLIYWDDRLLRTLIRLRDPFIARRVKILHIYPGFLKEVMDKDAISRGKDSHRPSSSFRVRLADIAQQFDKVFAPSKAHGDRQGAPQNLYDLPPRQATDKLRERLKTPQDVMTAVLDFLRGLPSLTDYYVTWYGLPTADDNALSLTSLAVPCIGTPLLSPTLTKLSLDISLENIHALCTADFHVARLEHLHLHLHSDHQLSPESLCHILHDRLANSVSNLAPYLRSLSIEAHEPMDIGPLFNGLVTLTKLDTLALALPLQKPHLGNPKALARFLRRQAETIRVLRLRATQHDAGSTGAASGAHWRRIGTPDPWSLNSWIRTAFGSDAGEEYQEWYYEQEEDGTHDYPLGEYDMDALESLEVSSNLLPLETAIYCAERFGSKVKTLGLLGSVKSFEFVKELVKVLGRNVDGCEEVDGDGEDVVWQWLTPSPVTPSSKAPPSSSVNTNLRTLRIGPVPLSPELLDLLANNLRSLQHLELIVKHFLPSQDDVPIYGPSRTRGDGDGIQLDEQVVCVPP